MPIPNFLRARRVTIESREEVDAKGGSGDEFSGQLEFMIERQAHSNWCWSAVGVSVSKYYDPGTTRTQCGLACDVLERQDCCGENGGTPDGCNVPWYLDQTLSETGNLAAMQSGAMSFEAIRQHISANAPIGCRIGWFGMGGHFVVVFGWLVGKSGEQYLDVADPYWMKARVAFSEFPMSYQTGGRWTHTYYTAASGAGAGYVIRDSGSPDTLGA